MISIESAAGLIFGNLQCTNMRQAMDALLEAEVVRLVTEWQYFITENRETAVSNIIKSVADHPDLATTWYEKSIHSQQYHAKIFQVIIDDTEQVAERPHSEN